MPFDFNANTRAELLWNYHVFIFFDKNDGGFFVDWPICKHCHCLALKNSHWLPSNVCMFGNKFTKHRYLCVLWFL